MSETVRLPKKKYDEMQDYLDRMEETVSVLSDKSTVKKIQEALNRMESGEYLTKKDMVN